MQDDKIAIRRLDPIPIPSPDDEGWIRNAKGEVIGYLKTRIMTREEFKSLFPGAVTDRTMGMEYSLLSWPLIGWFCAGWVILPRLKFKHHIDLDIMGVIIWIVCGAIVGPFGVVFLIFPPR